MNFLKNYGATILEFLCAGVAALVSYVLSDEGTKRLLRIFYHDIRNNPNITTDQINQQIDSFQNEAFWYLVDFALFFALFSLIIRIITQCKISTLEDDIKGYISNMEILEQKCKKLTLDKKNIEQSMKKVLNNYLLSIGEQLKLSNDERITLLLHNNNNGEDKFTATSRYSPNPNFHDIKDPSHEKKWALEKTWNDGWHYKKLSCPKKFFKAYPKECKSEYKMTAAECKSLKFKARLYAGLRITTPKNNINVAIILLESHNCSFDKDKNLKDDLASSVDKLKILLETFIDYIPSQTQIEKQENF